MRALPVLGAAAVERPLLPPFLATAAPVEFGDGFHGEELAEGLPFRWMCLRGVLRFAPQPLERYLELPVYTNFYDLSQELAIASERAAPEDHGLVRGWNTISVLVPAAASSVRLEASKVFPRAYYPGDGRELAVQVRSVVLHTDAARHAHVVRQHANRVRNVREMLERRVILSSTPPKLGIDIQGACNVKPPCVYCEWDFNKALEGDNVDVPFTRETLREYGDIFENASELVNCSIGEPFMGKNLDELLEAFGERGKLLEMSTNGQILTDGNIRRLLGRNVHLYVSLDAASPGTYARLRNDRFPQIIANLRRLVEAKGGRTRLPLVYLVFMPMRANVHEAEAFVRLCAELNVDRMVLRPLNDSEGVTLKWDRAGYHYDYQEQLLPWEELVRVSGRVAELCRRLGVDLADQMDFGGSMEAQFAEAFAAGRRETAAQFEGAAPAIEPPPPAQPAPQPAPPPAPARPLPSLGLEALPACTEPWTSFYILRRGVLPCCYGGKVMARMGEFKQVWNSPLMQGIRGRLLEGTFHTYCFESPDCPIVKKSQQARALSLREEAVLRGLRILDRMKRSGYGIPGKLYRSVKRYWVGGYLRIRRILGASAPLAR